MFQENSERSRQFDTLRGGPGGGVSWCLLWGPGVDVLVHNGEVYAGWSGSQPRGHLFLVVPPPRGRRRNPVSVVLNVFSYILLFIHSRLRLSINAVFSSVVMEMRVRFCLFVVLSVEWIPVELFRNCLFVFFNCCMWIPGCLCRWFVKWKNIIYSVRWDVVLPYYGMLETRVLVEVFLLFFINIRCDLLVCQSDLSPGPCLSQQVW